MIARTSRPPAGDGPREVRQQTFAYVQSLERGLAVIKSFGEKRPVQTLADVAKATGLDRAAARRFLLTLEALGYVEQEGRNFRLRPQAMELGYAYLSSLPWWRSAQRVAERLSERVGVNCAVGVLDRNEVLYVAYASAARFAVLNRSVGTHLPAFATAIGRVLLAGLDPDKLAQALDSIRLEKITPVTIVERAPIMLALKETRDQGYAIVDQELEIGLRSIGVPVHNRGGDLVAAISVSMIEGQASRTSLIDRYLGPLREAALDIRATMPT